MSKVPYDRHYTTGDLFAEPLPELVRLFQDLEPKQNVWDLGAGQGRDALHIARAGHRVLAVDVSQVGLAQLQQQAPAELRALIACKVADFNELSIGPECDCLLLDAMFHFYPKDQAHEKRQLERVSEQLRPGGLLVLAIVRTKKTQVAIDALLASLWQSWESCTDVEALHPSSQTTYRVLALRKPAL